jgi:hypothetical protein
MTVTLKIKLGPSPARFYNDYGGRAEAEADVLLVRHLVNAARVPRAALKDFALSSAFFLLAGTVIAAVIIFAVVSSGGHPLGVDWLTA